jgi:hypothetical protein
MIAALTVSRPLPPSELPVEPCRRFPALRDGVGPAPPGAEALSVGPLSRSGPIRFLDRLLVDERSIDHALRKVLRGRTPSPPELLGLQVTVMRYGQGLEVASRVVESVTHAVKQTLQTQV